MKINFEVSAKAARLIGRENIADVDGALSELIKNAYDADASCVYVFFQLPFPEVPSQAEPERFTSVLTEGDLKLVLSYYYSEKGKLVRKDDLSDSDRQALQSILFSYDRIIIADNGEGMPMETVESAWMQIATSSKETNIHSKKGRVKTGAKGIGRFALDKLSTRSVMYTKKREHKAIRWEVDWDQFTNAHLLRDVFAEVQEQDTSLIEILHQELDKELLKELSDFSWETGTIFILSPLRESWNPRLFAKVNTNLKSINPLGSVDTFTVIVHNQTFPEYSFHTEPVAISKRDYDYQLKIDYDGNKDLQVEIIRNEFDTDKKTAVFSVGECEKTFSLDQFWERSAFAESPFQKQEIHNGSHTLHLNVDDIIQAEDKDKVRAVGPFSADLYFVKSGKSDFPFVKDVPTRQRKSLLKRFSGIKLYRDNFKVRPYGDEGGVFDWLDLDGRANKSPAAVSHTHGQWRVLPYQMIGVVKIGRIENTALYDMANREGLTQNESYYYFIHMLQAGIERFEYDRQYIYREFARWKKECEKTISTTTSRVAEDVRIHGIGYSIPKSEKKETDKESSNSEESAEKEKARFSEQEYREAVDGLLRQSDQELKAKQTLEVISSSGVILNTFFHEFQSIKTQMTTRVSQLRLRIDYLLGHQPYKGIPFLDPYRKLDSFEQTDNLLSAWLQVIMQALEKDHLEKKQIYLGKEVNKIAIIWKPLLEEKRICLHIFPQEIPSDFSKLNIAIVDLYVIINNFVLNSVGFLEKSYQESRDIFIILQEQDQTVTMRMENNGPPLSNRYQDRPMSIFNIGETEKEDGTGLGLFLMQEVVDRTDGKLHLLEKKDGFGIEIEWRK